MALVHVGNDKGDGKGRPQRAFGHDPHAHRVEQAGDLEVGADGVGGGLWWRLHAVAQFLGSRKIEVPPRRGFGAERKLFETLRQRFLRLRIARIGAHDMAKQGRCPAVLAVRCRRFGQRHNFFGAAHRSNIAHRRRTARQRVEIDRIAIERPEIALVDGAGVEFQRAIIRPVEPRAGERRRQGDGFTDLHRIEAGIHQPHAFIMDKGIGLGVQQQVAIDLARPPARPEMRGEHDLRLAGVAPPRLEQITRPAAGIADERAARRQQVVHGAIGIFGHAQRLQIGQVKVHFGWRLGVRRQLEFEAHAIDGADFATFGDAVVGRHQRHRAPRPRRPQPRRDMAGHPAWQQPAEHVIGAPGHRRAGNDIFRNRLGHEIGRRDHRHLACRRIGRRHDRRRAAEMIAMTMGVDDAGDRTGAQFFVDQRQGGGGDFGGGQRIDDDPTGLAANDRHVRQIEATHLPDAVTHLEQAVLGQQRSVAPQTGIDRCRRRAGEARLLRQVADDGAVLVADDRIGECADKAACREIEILLVVPVQLGRERTIFGDGRRGRASNKGLSGSKRAGEQDEEGQ